MTPQGGGLVVRVLTLVLLACGAAPRASLATEAQSSDILRRAIKEELHHLPRHERQNLLERSDANARTIAAVTGGSASAQQRFDALNAHFFGPEGFTAISDLTTSETTSIASVLQNRRGTCVGLAIVYLSLARTLGLEARAVATPVHVFVRVTLNGQSRNLELTEGGLEIDNDTYKHRYHIDDASVAAGAFMGELSNDELIAHLLSNQAVALSKHGNLKAALKRYDRALRLHSKLVAAWYNRGIDLMDSGKLRKALDSFNHAIELYPSDSKAHNNRGLAKFKLGRVAAARGDFLKALELDPALYEAEHNLKRLDAQQGNAR